MECFEKPFNTSVKSIPSKRIILHKCYEASGDEFFSFLIFSFPQIFIFCTIPMFNSVENSGSSGRLYFGGAPKSLQMVTAAIKLKDTYSLEEKL